MGWHRVTSGLLFVLVLPAQQAKGPVVRAADEAGSPVIRSFTPKNYKGSPQNLAITQDSRGILYFANTECVLEYDGVSWRRIPLPGSAAARSVATDGSLVYVGGQGDFGYLEPDSRGSMTYRSLTALIPRDARNFRDVWTIIPTPQGVYFGTYQGIYRWSRMDGKLRVWKPQIRFGRLIGAAKTLWVVSQGQGLLRMSGDNLEPVKGGERLSTTELRSIFEWGQGLELATAKGLFRLRNGELEAESGPAAKVLEQSRIYTAAPLRSGSLAVATLLAGVLVIAPDGSIQRRLNKEHGLLDNGTTSVFEDHEGGVWVTSSAGVDRADLAMTRFAHSEGLQGSAYTVARYQGSVYVGTDQGLFRLARSPGALAVFEPVTGAKGLVFGMAETPDGLLVTFPDGVYSVSGTQATIAMATPSPYEVSLSTRDPGLAYVAGREKVFSMRREAGKWKQERMFTGSSEDFRAVREGPDGVVWVATQEDVVRIDWRETEARVKRFGADAGVPGGFKNIYRIRGEVVVATPKGLRAFEPAKGVFVPWLGVGREFADGSKPVSLVREAPNGRLWISGDGYHGELVPTSNADWTWKPMTLGQADLAELYAILPEGDGTIWAAGTDGFLARYTPQAQPSAPEFSVFVRRVQTQGGSIAYDGAYAGSGDGKPARIGHGDNSLRVEFAAPWLNDQSRVEYQVRLEGADSGWSNWSQETTKDYTHLWEGAYRFLVRAKNGAGTVSRAAAFEFTVQPPWFRTWPAYLFYVAALGLSFWSLLKWRVSKLEAEKAQLEQIVEERTVKIREQRDQILVEQEKSETLLLNILPASVAEELKRSGTVQPQNYDEVTVCFTDFAGFTLSSEALPAGELVSALHEYFTSFDEIVEEFGLEKLKTIGDAYMLVSGLPKPRAAHAVDAVLAALRMVEVVEELALRGEGPVWQVRVGLHSGPVAAGVVGVRKFAFDIWGNTVNLASRMESSGAVGRVNLSESTWALVDDFIECEERGHVQTKDKRDLRMYFAMGLKPDLSEPGEFARRYRARFGVDPAYDVPGSKKVVL